jgi:hypothetical protein
MKSGVSILLAADLRCNRKLEAYATKSATLKFIFDKALGSQHRLSRSVGSSKLFAACPTARTRVKRNKKDRTSLEIRSFYVLRLASQC